MFPTIFTLAIEGLGRHTSQGSGILCMAIVGGAIVPVVQGALADAIGIHHGFVVAGLCYVYIAWYGLSFRSLDKSTARAAEAALATSRRSAAYAVAHGSSSARSRPAAGRAFLAWYKRRL